MRETSAHWYMARTHDGPGELADKAEISPKDKAAKSDGTEIIEAAKRLSTGDQSGRDS